MINMNNSASQTAWHTVQYNAVSYYDIYISLISILMKLHATFCFPLVQSSTDSGMFSTCGISFLFRQQFPLQQLQAPHVKILIQSKQTNLQELAQSAGACYISVLTKTYTYASSIILFAFLESNIPTT